MPSAVLEVVPLDVAKIKALREKLGLSQEQAAQKAGFRGRQAWSNIESGQQGNPQLMTIERIAKVLGVKAKDLLR
jgi:transcriptional regulator with XRE-family HTH domain